MNKESTRPDYASGRPYKSFLLFALMGLLIFAAVLASCQQESQEESTVTPKATITALAEQPDDTPQPDEVVTTVPTLVPTQPATAVVERTTSTPKATDQPAEEPDPEPTSEATATSDTEASVVDLSEAPDGALISVEMEGRVGVLLDEVPEEMRESVVQTLLERPESYWSDLAHRQVQLTKRRLNFRNFVYSGKGQLPLPPEELWSIQVDPAGPARERIEGHDLVVTGYTFTGTLLTDTESPGEAEPALSRLGGKWDEPFLLPVDPDLLLQRTGNACLNEAGYPPNSFDSENAWIFFDYTCEGDDGGILGCHRSRLHNQSCVEALTDRVGTIETEVHFERLDWDPDLAQEVRIGQITREDGPDLNVVGDDLENNRIIYRYFSEDSCALAEQCISGSGWRRLLQFTATVHNVGAETLYIGPVVAENPVHNLFQYNSCHAHFHFSDYGDFYFGGTEENISSKQAFCVESTNRFSNNEWSPLTHGYTCRFQGVETGWVDEYVAGLDCQWIDITDVDVPDEGSTFSLGLVSNPDGFLCEGTPVFDEDGNRAWEPSGLTTPDGAPINRPSCDYISDWDANNDESRDVSLLPTGSFVTEPCAAGFIGPLRNCGFTPLFEGVEYAVEEPEGDPRSSDAEIEAPEGAFACQAGELVQMSCGIDDGAAAQIFRVCDYSAALETGVACTFTSALANEVIDAGDSEITFTCPGERSEDEPGGLFSLYNAPVLGEDEAEPISCVVQQ